MKNAWGWEILGIGDIIARRDFRPMINDVVGKILGAINERFVITSVTDLLHNTRTAGGIVELEKILHARIIGHGPVTENVVKGMWTRAETILSEIEPYFVGESL